MIINSGIQVRHPEVDEIIEKQLNPNLVAVDINMQINIWTTADYIETRLSTCCALLQTGFSRLRVNVVQIETGLNRPSWAARITLP